MNFVKAGREKRYDIYPNLLDIHVPRLIEAHRVVGTYMKDTELLHYGLLRFENFLGKTGIEHEIFASPIKDGQSDESRVINLKGESFKAMPKLWKEVAAVFQDHMAQEVNNLFCQNTYLQHLYNCPDDNDEQKVFHSDTFFPCVKFWYFPKAVDDGAFWYVPNSPVLTEGLIAWHTDRVADMKAGKSEAWRGPGHREGSFRTNVEELKGLGLEPIQVSVKDDTLVIANVHGFHRRGDTKKPCHRLAIHGSIRIGNPFEH